MVQDPVRILKRLRMKIGLRHRLRLRLYLYFKYKEEFIILREFCQEAIFGRNRPKKPQYCLGSIGAYSPQ
jgi:hypothetical protein